MSLIQDDRIELRKILEGYGEKELRTLCQDMDVDYESLPASGKAGKARELIKYLHRRQRIDELKIYIQQHRPDISLAGQYPRRIYLEKLRDVLNRPEATKKGNGAETYAKTIGRRVEKIFGEEFTLRLQEKEVFFPLEFSVADEIRYLHRFRESSEVEYKDVPELMKELMDCFGPKASGDKARQKILLFGNPGSGKTKACEHLVWRIACDALKDDRLPLPIFIDFGDVDATDLRQLHEKWRDDATGFMLGMIRTTLEKFDERGALGESVKEALLSRIEGMIRNSEVFFIIDSINEVAHDLFDDLWGSLIDFVGVGEGRTASIASGCGFVVAVREYALRPEWANVGRYIAICELDTKQVEEFAALYLSEDLEEAITKAKQFVAWLKREKEGNIPLLARTPFYLRKLIEWYNAHGGQGSTPELAELLSNHVKTKLLEEAACPEELVGEVEKTLQHLAYWATRESAMGTCLSEDKLFQIAYPAGVPLKCERHLHYAEKAGLVHRMGEQIRFDHQCLQEYFAAVEWTRCFSTSGLFLSDQGAMESCSLEKDLYSIQWQDTIRLAVSLSENPGAILEFIYGNIDGRLLNAPGSSIWWPVRQTVPAANLTFDSIEELDRWFWKEVARFHLALRCLAGVSEKQELPIADELLSTAGEVLCRGHSSAAALTAKVLGEVRHVKAVKALQKAFPELCPRGYSNLSLPASSVRAEAVRALESQFEMGMEEAEKTIVRIREESPGSLFSRVLEDVPIWRKPLGFLALLLPDLKANRTVLEQHASREAQRLIGGVILGILLLPMFCGCLGLCSQINIATSQAVSWTIQQIPETISRVKGFALSAGLFLAKIAFVSGILYTILEMEKKIANWREKFRDKHPKSILKWLWQRMSSSFLDSIYGRFLYRTRYIALLSLVISLINAYYWHPSSQYAATFVGTTTSAVFTCSLLSIYWVLFWLFHLPIWILRELMSPSGRSICDYPLLAILLSFIIGVFNLLPTVFAGNSSFQEWISGWGVFQASSIVLILATLLYLRVAIGVLISLVPIGLVIGKAWRSIALRHCKSVSTLLAYARDESGWPSVRAQVIKRLPNAFWNAFRDSKGKPEVSYRAVRSTLLYLATSKDSPEKVRKEACHALMELYSSGRFIDQHLEDDELL